MATAYRALGTTLSVGEAPAIKIAGLTSIDGPQLSAETIEVTTLDSDGGYKEFIPGFKDGGDVSIEGLFRPDGGQEKLRELFESGEAAPYTIEFPAETRTKWKFKGVVTALSNSATLNDPLSFSATIKVSGKPELEITGA